MRVLVLNGPNLDRLGARDPQVYGSETIDELEEAITREGKALGIEVEAMQSNHEGELIDRVNASDHDGLVINPGALAHTSRALADSIGSIPAPAVEVHISNIREREPWRSTSLVSAACVRSIYGRGTKGYGDALRHLANRAAHPADTVRYGPHPDNVGDLRRGKRGIVVLAHGGFWRHEWERDTMDSVAVHLAKKGHATWNIEYRRIGAGGGWPGSAHDVLMALDFIPQLGLDPGPVSVVGHSAGGHVAMWAASRASVTVNRLTALAPLVDLERHAGSGLYGAAEARRLLASGAPPRMGTGGVPTTVIHGAGDEMVPLEHSRLLETREDVELLTPDLGHFELLDPARGWYEMSPW